MESDPYPYIVLAVALALTAFTAAAEMALAGANRGRVRELAEAGNRRAALVDALLSDASQFLITGTLLRSLGLLLAGVALAELFAAFLSPFRFLLALLALWILFSLVQVVVRAAVQPRADTMALQLAPSINVGVHLLWPLTAFLRHVGHEVGDGDADAEEESVFLSEEGLRLLINVRDEEDSIQESEKQMIASILDMEETVAREVMVPRIDMVVLNVEMSLREALDLVIEAGHSRIPVYEGNADRILGFLYAKDLLKCFQQNSIDMPLRDLLRPAHFVPITKKLNDLFQEMQKQRVHVAVVVDEYGGTAGLITIEDILEEIVGDIQDEYDEEEGAYVEAVGADTYILNARLDLDTLSDLLGVHLPDEDADTLGGLLYSLLGHVPNRGEAVECENWFFTVLSLDGRRIDQVRAEPVRGGPAQTDAPAKPQSTDEATGPDGLINISTFG